MQRSLLRKVGLYCITCDIYYSPNLTKQYTVMRKQYTPKPNQYYKSNGPGGLQDDISPLLWILFHILSGSNIVKIEDDFCDPSIP